jgi:DNA-binding CsgD family transcriptional regulator
MNVTNPLYYTLTKEQLFYYNPAMSDPRKSKSSRKGSERTNKYFHTLNSLHLVYRTDPTIQETITNDKPTNAPNGRRSSDRVSFDLYDRWLSLSEREQDVTFLTCQGHKDQQIAFKMGVSVRTVRSYLENVYRKMYVNSKVELRLLFVNFDFGRYFPHT